MFYAKLPGCAYLQSGKDLGGLWDPKGPDFSLSPDNSLLRSGSGGRVDRSDIGLCWFSRRCYRARMGHSIRANMNLNGRVDDLFVDGQALANDVRGKRGVVSHRCECTRVYLLAHTPNVQVRNPCVARIGPAFDDLPDFVYKRVIHLPIQLIDQPASDCGGVNRLLDEHIAHVDVRIAELSQLKQELNELRQRCQREQAVDACGILQGLASMETEPRHERNTHLG